VRSEGRWLWMMLAAGVTMGGGPGCAGQSQYRPTEAVAGELEGAPAARYPLPPESPRGDVNVASMGVVSVQPAGGGDKVPMIELRLAVSNDNDTGNWTLDVREQRLSLAGGSDTTPAIVSGNASSDPMLVIPPGQRRTVDLYFPSPVAEGKLPGFDLLWVVHTPQRAVAERTPFQEDHSREGDAYGAPTTVIGFGPAYWYDPFYYPFYAAPPVVFYGPGPRWYPAPPYRGGRRHWPGDGIAPRSSASAPPVSASPNVSAPRPMPAPPMMPSAPSMSAPAPAPPPAVPAQPNISAPAPR
jgi:hypothetical protein